MIFLQVLAARSRANTADRHMARGNDLFRRKNYVQATKAYEDGIAAEPNCSVLQGNKGAVLAILKR